MHKLILLFVAAFALSAHAALDCSTFLNSDRRISTTDANLAAQIPHFPLAPGARLALVIGPQLIGQLVRVQVLDRDETPSMIEGTVRGSLDNWFTFTLVEINTGLELQISVEHPALGVRRVELLGNDIPQSISPELAALDRAEESFAAEERDLVLNREITGLEKKINWYRRWNGRFLRTTLYDRQAKLAQLEYLLGIGKKDEALALLRLDIDNTKIPAIAILKETARAKVLAQQKIAATDARDQERIALLERESQARLREQGEAMATHYGDFRAAVLRLDYMAKASAGLYPERAISLAQTLSRQINVLNSSRTLMPNLLNVRREPTLDTVRRAFFAQPYSLTKKLREDLWAERMTFAWQIFGKLNGQELLRRTVDAAAEKFPYWVRLPFNTLRRGTRDMNARRFDMPQIERLMHLQVSDTEKLEELRKIHYGDRQSTLLKNFARVIDAPENKMWQDLKLEAGLDTRTADFLQAMKDAEVIGAEWGPLSKYYHQDEMNLTAAVITAGGVGSAFLYHQYGDHSTWLWGAIDSVVQYLPWN